MKILFLCKRQYMRKDVLDDRYGRLYELPAQLARRGHQLSAVCLSYRSRNEGIIIDQIYEIGSLQWHSYNLWPNLSRYYKAISTLIGQLKPDLIIGGSDSLHIILTAALAKRYGKPYAVDLYDNFDSFGLTCLPAVKPLYHAAVRNARAVFCVSSPLAEFVRERSRARGFVIPLESTIDQNSFFPQSSVECRVALELPLNARLIGTAGALDNKSRDTRCLYDAFHILRGRYDDLHLVLAGRTDKATPIPQEERVHYLGEIPHHRVSMLFNALDVAFIGLKDDAFGKYAFPQKAYEIMATGTPLVCSDTGALHELLRAYPQCRYRIGDSFDLAEKIAGQLGNRILPDIPIPDWAGQAEQMEKVLQKVLF